MSSSGSLGSAGVLTTTFHRQQGCRARRAVFVRVALRTGWANMRQNEGSVNMHHAPELVWKGAPERKSASSCTSAARRSCAARSTSRAPELRRRQSSRRKRRPPSYRRGCRVPQPWQACAKSAAQKLSATSTTGLETHANSMLIGALSHVNIDVVVGR